MPDTSCDKMAALCDAAWMLLSTHSIDEVEFEAVAEMADVDQGLALALAGSVQRLVLAKMDKLNR